MLGWSKLTCPLSSCHIKEEVHSKTGNSPVMHLSRTPNQMDMQAQTNPTPKHGEGIVIRIQLILWCVNESCLDTWQDRKWSCHVPHWHDYCCEITSNSNQTWNHIIMLVAKHDECVSMKKWWTILCDTILVQNGTDWWHGHILFLESPLFHWNSVPPIHLVAKFSKLSQNHLDVVTWGR